MGSGGRVAEEEGARREGRKGMGDKCTAWDVEMRECNGGGGGGGDGGGGGEKGFEEKGEGRR